MNREPLPIVTQPKIGTPSTIDIGELRRALVQSVSGEVRFDRLDRALYSTDASVYQIVPLGVVLPKSADDVRATLAACRRLGVPITARGGGTSQAGQSIGPGVILDFSKYLNRIVEVNQNQGWAWVEPGCVLDDLNQHVKKFGLQFAPDISTANRATIGGMVANNSSGTHSIIYGKTIDHVLELKVLLADGSLVHARPVNSHGLEEKCRQSTLEGACYRTLRRLASENAAEIDRRFPKILRRVGGYNLDRFVDPNEFNLAEVVVGSEGTLGIVIEAKVRLVALPKAKAVLVVQFSNLLDALGATPGILKHQPAAVEVMDRFILDCTKLNAEAARLRDFLQGDPDAVLIIEFYGETAESLTPRLESLKTELQSRGIGQYFHTAVDGSAQARIWKLRTLALGLSMVEKGDAKAISFVEDTAVSPDRLRDYIAEFLGILARHETRAGVYAHASVGCLHVRPIVNLKTASGVRQFQVIADEVADLVLKYGGALSGEHGDGLVRSPFQEKMFGPQLYGAFRELKAAFDPEHLLNPGKIVDAPPLTSALRFGPAYVTPEISTTFDFSIDGGLVRSAELCAGVGECRKKRTGAMCPSYQATCEEQHSTRGRANTLRLALTGQLGLSGLDDPAVFAALDLCLECKACKTECPTNVDMARIKAEFLHQHFKKRGLPWRNWLFGNIATLSRWGSRFAPVANWATKHRGGRWLNEKCFGVDRRRTPPRFASQPFLARPNIGTLAEIANPSVILFADTFVNWFEPELGLAALAILQKVGQPLVPNNLRCCGRPMISNGMLDQAIQLAKHNVAQLLPWAERGIPIVTCEPSCILTVKDDYPALLSGLQREQAMTVAQHCLTFEEYLSQQASKLKFSTGPKKILVQGHCHQRSLVGNGSIINLLKRIPEAEVFDLDAGCCGMAGSFGYECEHYDLSRQVGEQRLFPAIRASEPETVLVASGFSCRSQIQHFTTRTALHPAALLAELVGD